MNDTDDVYGDMLGWFDILREEIQLLKDNYDEIEGFVDYSLNDTEDRVDAIFEETLNELEERIDEHQFK